MRLWHYELDTPLGPMWAAFDERGRLRHLAFGGLDPRATMPLAPKAQREAFRYLVRQLEAYFARTLRTFTVPLDPQGSEFERRVWDELAQIPYGETLSIRDLVQRCGSAAEPEVIRAAALASPIAILIPCHRLIDPDGLPVDCAGGFAITTTLRAHEGTPPEVQGLPSW